MSGLHFAWSHDLRWEKTRLNIVRIALGLLLLWRQTAITVAAHHLEIIAINGWKMPLLLDLAEWIAIFCLTIGLFTPIAAAVVGLSYSWYSIQNGTYNLGPMIALSTIIAMWFLKAGTSWSADALFLRSPRPAVQAAWQRLYRYQSDPGLEGYSLVRLTVLAIYAAISLAAVLQHLSDSYWQEGQTVAFLFTHSYFGSRYAAARALMEQAPQTTLLFSSAAIILQTVFQLLMLPLLFFRTGFYFVLLQGIMFFLSSVFLMSLSILPLVEVLLWYWIFFNAPIFPRCSSRPWVAIKHLLQKAHCGKAPVIYAGCYLALFLLLTIQLVLARGFGIATPPAVDRLLQYAGLWPPDVFNSIDLRSGDRWPVIYRASADNADPAQRVLVPFTGLNGEKLAYHWSDLLYYRSLIWRRHMIFHSDAAAVHSPGHIEYDRLREIAQFDYNFGGFTGPIRYDVEIYENRASRADLKLAAPERYTPKRIHQYSFEISGAANRAN